MFEITDTLKARFWSKVDQGNPDACWNWTGGSRGVGYGAFKIEGKCHDAHRVAWVLFNGHFPPGRSVVMHSCDNRSCCNPAHLMLGTYRDNSRDAADKGRLGFARVTRTDPLTDDQLRAIWDAYTRGVSRRQLARQWRFPQTSFTAVLRKAEQVSASETKVAN